MLSNSWSVELTNTAVFKTKIEITLMIQRRGAMSRTEMVRSLRSSQTEELIEKHLKCELLIISMIGGWHGEAELGIVLPHVGQP